MSLFIKLWDVWVKRSEGHALDFDEGYILAFGHNIIIHYIYHGRIIYYTDVCVYIYINYIYKWEKKKKKRGRGGEFLAGFGEGLGGKEC